ncbi:hypothetical protein [Kitasatospora sp. NPDC057198]|uniref:hypothetical protein n=1 Tax=Kitasatospora sp. NPDC057198 TaxID=3346046 RepID=UPI003629FA9F
MRVFVTGSTGWIGPAAVDGRLASGHRVSGPARSERAAAARFGVVGHLFGRTPTGPSGLTRTPLPRRPTGPTPPEDVLGGAHPTDTTDTTDGHGRDDHGRTA